MVFRAISAVGSRSSSPRKQAIQCACEPARVSVSPSRVRSLRQRYAVASRLAPPLMSRSPLLWKKPNGFRRTPPSLPTMYEPSNWSR
jgi:hypothetical protein